MLSTSLSPYLGAEIAYRQERLLADRGLRTTKRTRRLGPAIARSTRALAHRPAPSH